LENEYPGGNLLMVTVTDDEARRIEQQPDEDIKAEIMIVLRKMFGNDIPEMEAILVPRWGENRFFRGTYSNWPIGVSTRDFNNVKVKFLSRLSNFVYLYDLLILKVHAMKYMNYGYI
jgi:polyamine oxidase